MNVFIKEREICFNDLHQDSNQAHSAMQLLSGMPGIENLTVTTSMRLTVCYHLAYFSLEELESVLTEFGFHLDNSLLVKLKRALYYYTDETERINLGCTNGQCKITRDVFINHYLHRPHGCRDQRPEYWRNYL